MVVKRISFRVAVVAAVMVSFALLAARSRPIAGLGGVEPLLFASGLHQPRGLAFAPDGLLYVAEAGAGGARDTMAPGRISRLDADGRSTILVDNLPAASAAQPLFSQSGPAAIVRAPVRVLTSSTGGSTEDATYVFVGPTSAGPTSGPPASGLTRLIEDQGLWRLDAMLALTDALAEGQPPAATVWGQGAAVALDGALYAALPLANQLIRLEPAVLSAGADADPGTRASGLSVITGFVGPGQRNPLPLSVTTAADGAVYVALFGAEPFRAGSGRIVRVEPDGRWQPIYEGLNFPVALSFAPDGQLFALEFAGGYDPRDGQFQPRSGRLLAIGPGPARRRSVVREINYPTALAFSPAGDVYFTESGALSPAGEGRVLRVPAQTLRSLR